jgi:hypothetical protein
LRHLKDRCVSCRMEWEEVVKLLVEREGWENVCVVCCSFFIYWRMNKHHEGHASVCAVCPQHTGCTLADATTDSCGSRSHGCVERRQSSAAAKTAHQSANLSSDFVVCASCTDTQCELTQVGVSLQCAALTVAELCRSSTYPCDWLSHESVVVSAGVHPVCWGQTAQTEASS